MTALLCFAQPFDNLQSFMVYVRRTCHSEGNQRIQLPSNESDVSRFPHNMYAAKIALEPTLNVLRRILVNHMH